MNKLERCVSFRRKTVYAYAAVTARRFPPPALNARARTPLQTERHRASLRPKTRRVLTPRGAPVHILTRKESRNSTRFLFLIIRTRSCLLTHHEKLTLAGTRLKITRPRFGPDSCQRVEQLGSSPCEEKKRKEKRRPRTLMISVSPSPRFGPGKSTPSTNYAHIRPFLLRIPNSHRAYISCRSANSQGSRKEVRNALAQHFGIALDETTELDLAPSESAPAEWWDHL